METKSLTDKEIKALMYRPNSEPKIAYYARLRTYDLETLKRGLRLSGFSKSDSGYLHGIIREKTPTEPTDDPHPDGWYDR